MSVSLDNVKAIGETAKALRVRLADGTSDWVPKAHVDDDSEVYAEGHEGKLVVSDWIAEQKGWEG